jgi:AcrR family transcriptional regulator
MADVNPTSETTTSETPTRRRGRPTTGARDQLVRAMRELLLERDFDEIATEEVLARAGVSRGGMYHHFNSKVELFQAAYEASERDAIKRLTAIGAEHAAHGASPFEQLLAACVAYVRERAAGGELQRIGPRQSRVVLGWEGLARRSRAARNRRD